MKLTTGVIYELEQKDIQTIKQAIQICEYLKVGTKLIADADFLACLEEGSNGLKRILEQDSGEFSLEEYPC